MRYIFLVAWREYAENAKTKGFWIGMFMFPLIIFVSVKVTSLLETKGTPTRHYVLIDQSREFGPVISSNLDKMPRHLFLPATLPSGVDTNADLAALSQQLKPYLRHERNVQAEGHAVTLDAAILIPSDIDKQIIRPGAKKKEEGHGVEFWSDNLADNSLRDDVERDINNEVHRKEYVARGMDIKAIHQVEQTYVPFGTLNPKKEAGHEKVSNADIIRQWAPSGFVYLLWMSIFGIVQMLLNNIIEEKSNRIIEVLLSSVTPGELMMGKLFGIAALGLTLVSVWIMALFSALLLNNGGGTNDLPGQLLSAMQTSHLIPMFAVYFLLGYLMYAAFILALGSVCNTIKEAQNYMGMITVCLMVPLMTMAFIPKDPNGTLARVLSWIPIYTPFTMMNRVNADPPLIDVIGTLILLVASTLGALWMAGKVFRIGILRTGQPPKILELIRWLKD